MFGLMESQQQYSGPGSDGNGDLWHCAYRIFYQLTVITHHNAWYSTKRPS